MQGTWCVRRVCVVGVSVVCVTYGVWCVGGECGVSACGVYNGQCIM